MALPLSRRVRDAVWWNKQRSSRPILFVSHALALRWADEVEELERKAAAGGDENDTES